VKKRRVEMVVNTFGFSEPSTTIKVDTEGNVRMNPVLGMPSLEALQNSEEGSGR